MRKLTLLLLLGVSLGTSAQTPGGVDGSELWFKVAPLTTDLQGYYRWQDFSGDSIRLMLMDKPGHQVGANDSAKLSPLLQFQSESLARRRIPQSKCQL